LSAFLDTNVKIRHLTGDHTDMTERTTAALSSAEPRP
jgi:predicted nucleic acid-binding protein